MVLVINGGRKLSGEAAVMAAKNSALPIIAACILTRETVVLKNCPPLLDILAMLEIIKSLGGRAEYDGGNIVINCGGVQPVHIPSSLTGGIRSSVFILGPLLSRFKEARINYPGGCEIGSRPIDVHLDGLNALGVRTITGGGVIECDGRGLVSGRTRLRLPSVGATENLMMAAVLTDGTTIIENAAREPEIEDLANFINRLGGKVSGAGSKTITVEGVKALGGCEYTPIPDRIAAGTFLAACAGAGGKIRLKNVNVLHIYAIIDRLQAAGCKFSYQRDSITVNSSGNLRAIDRTSTMPYPGFPTDMQPQLVAVLSAAAGKSVIEENLFESRFKYINQLKKMGANIEYSGQRAIITGVGSLSAAELEAQDLRGGAALIIAGLMAKGASRISGLEHIDRGYYLIENDLKNLGGDIQRLSPLGTAD